MLGLGLNTVFCGMCWANCLVSEKVKCLNELSNAKQTIITKWWNSELSDCEMVMIE